MPLTIASVFSFIPTNIWRPLKKFVTKDNTIVFDIAFKLSTKYTPALLMVMMCLSFANQFVRSIELDCATSGSSGGAAQGRNGYGGGGGGDSELNDFCWNHETFLVVKALDPKMRGMVTYPGVSGYNREKDELIRQRYYKYVWLILGKLMVVSFLPYFFWNVWATKKIKAIVEVPGSPGVSSEDQRLAYYLETVGFNGTFGTFYLFCKLLATVSPFVQWYYLCGFLGRRYKYYGVDVVINFMDETAPWPNPMDALFPKMAKCEWSRYGFGGDIELKSAQCQLPMNNITQWSFFVYWWWIAVIFLINILSIFKLLIFTCPPFRRFHYRKFVGAACRDDVEKARTYTGHAHNGQVPKILKHKKSDIIEVNLSFGDWLVLNFVKRNMQDWQFRDFVRKMVTTENTVLQLKQMPIIPVHFPPSCPPMEGKGETWHPDEPDGGHKNANMEIGFIQSVLNPNCNSLPSYSACETVSTDCDIVGSSSASSDSEFVPGQFKNQNQPINQEFAINITKPVKVDRVNLNTNKKKSNEKEVKKSAAPSRPKLSMLKKKSDRYAADEDWGYPPG